MSLSRLFCFSGGSARDDWHGSHFGDLASASARARVLEVVEAEVEERFAAVGPLPPGAAAHRASQDAALMRRVYQANLPAVEVARCRDLLRKLAAIDGARQAAEAEQAALAEHLRSAEAAHRQAEFARARAEAMATARGEALMHAQQATREAEMQQMQLAELLQLACGQLGIELELTPAKALSPLLTPLPAGEPPTLHACLLWQCMHNAGRGAATTPQAVRQSIFSERQLAQVAASLSKLPRPPMSWRGAGDVEQQLRRVAEEREQEEREHRRSQQAALEREQAEAEAAAKRAACRASHRGSREGSRGGGSAAAQPQAHSEGQQLSGFTVYTNSLQAAGLAGPEDEGEVAQRGSRAPRLATSAPPSVAGEPPGERDSAGSGVQWRSLSSAALSSRSQGSEAEQHEPRHAAQQGGRHPPKLLLPGMHTSQMDSLVRIGASQQSPDPHRSRHVSVEAPHPALPQGPQWDSAINPLQSDADAERFVQQLRAEQQRPGGSRPSSRPASRPSSRPGSRRASQDGPRPVAQSMAAVVGREEPRHAPGMRAGSEPPAPAPQAARPADLPQLEVPVFDGGKVPGAGTWVSPSLAAMIAHKKGRNPLLDGGEPSPPSHIKAVFGAPEDREFYGPMAAHLKQAQQAAPAPAPQPRPPTSTSAESIRGPARQQPPSNRSSMEGGGGSAEWERRQLAASAASQGAAAAAAQAPAPEGRQAAFLSRFQPMGQYAHAAAPAPRRSSVAVSQLSSGQRGSLAPDENLAASALAKSTVRGPGLPPRHSQQGAPGAAAAQPATKRSLDSMRASMGGGGSGGAAAQNIKASLHAVEAAMAALRDANPHLSHQHSVAAAPGRQSQLAAPAPGRAPKAAPLAVHHTRTRSLPESSLDLPLHELSAEEHQRRRRQQQQRAPQAA